MTLSGEALAAAPQAFGPIRVDPLLHDVLQRHGTDTFQLIAGPAGQPGWPGAADVEPIRLHMRSYGQNSLCDHVLYDDSAPDMVDMDRCIICATTMIAVSAMLDQRDRRYLTLGLCPQCGFIQHIRRPPRAYYEQFYAKVWDGQRQDQGFTREMIQPIYEAVDVLSRYAPPGARVVEIGSGWGGTLAGFAARGFEAYGIEPSVHRARFVREELGLSCEALAAESIPVGTAPYEAGSFDVLYSNHALEHVFDARQVLEHLYPLLKDQGHALIGLPNFFCEHPTILTHDITHGSSFSHGNLLYLLQTIGFDLVRDFSTHRNLMMLLRKCPPFTESQARSKLDALSRVQPHRALAHVLERLGLSGLPERWQQDVDLHGRWVADYPNMPAGPEAQVDFSCLMVAEDAPSVDAIRDVIRRRAPITALQDRLPIQYCYASNGVPLWYY